MNNSGKIYVLHKSGGATTWKQIVKSFLYTEGESCKVGCSIYINASAHLKKKKLCICKCNVRDIVFNTECMTLGLSSDLAIPQHVEKYLAHGIKIRGELFHSFRPVTRKQLYYEFHDPAQWCKAEPGENCNLPEEKLSN